MRPALAVAFDLDGTLVDSRLDIAAACNHVLVGLGRSPLDPAHVATFVGNGVRALLAGALSLPGDAPELGRLVEEFVAYYAAHPVERTTWMPGAREAIAALADRPLALVTNKARTVTTAILDALHARGLFAAVYAGGDGPLKPSAEPIVAVARALAVDAASLWVVGDGEQDVLAARAAGAVAVAVLGGFGSEERLRAARPDAVLAHLAELAPLVRQRAS
ncbi:MAG TPA: HAD hydrolase-like protein [Polyangiaceae bacterium]|jgi:phosphoglycolate phosphatase